MSGTEEVDGVSGLTKRSEKWPSPRPRKKMKRTYSSREVVRFRRERETMGGKGHLGGLGNEPSIRIPVVRINEQGFVREILKTDSLHVGSSSGELPLSPTTKSASRKGYSSLQVQSQSLYRLKLLEGIRSGFETLLKVTAEGSSAKSSGRRSLFSTCLRKIPEYIAAEELCCKEEDWESTVDISSAVYNDLEAFGSSPSGGWKPLREVVRSHGISLLGSAMSEGLLNVSEARYLVKSCLRHRAFDEGERLIEYLAYTRADMVGELELDILDYFARNSGRYGFQYRQLTILLREGLLPVDWISKHEMIPCWNRLILSLSKTNGESKDAAILLRTALSIGYRASRIRLHPSHIHNVRLRARNISCKGGDESSLPSEKVERKEQGCALSERADLDQGFYATSAHLLTVLTTVEILPSLASILESSTTGTAVSGILRDLALDVLQIFEADEFDTHPGSPSQLRPHHDSMCLPVLAARMALVAAAEDDEELDPDIHHHLDFLRRFKHSQSFADTAASFLCAVANCCGQAGSGDAFDYIQEIVQLLTRKEISRDGEREMKVLFGRIAINAAVRFSQATSLPRHLSWALDLESSFHRASIGADHQTPTKPSVRSISKTKSGFRWEEGICEWVAGTPCIPTPKPAGDKQHYYTAPELSRDAMTVISLNYSPTEPSTPITGDISGSTKPDFILNETFEILPNPGPSFLHVLIDPSSRIRGAKVQDGNQATPDSTDIYPVYSELEADELSTHESSPKTTPCNPQTLCSKVSSCFGYLKHKRGRQRRHGPRKKSQVPYIAAKSQARGPSDPALPKIHIYTTTIVDSVSEDELG